MLQSPIGQEVFQPLDVDRSGCPPAQAVQHLPEVFGAGPLLPSPVVGEHTGIDTELLGEPVHGSRRDSRQVIGYEAKPGKGTQLNRQAQPVGLPAMVFHHPAAITGLQGEVGDEVLSGDISREARQLGQLGVAQKPGRHVAPIVRSLA